MEKFYSIFSFSCMKSSIFAKDKIGSITFFSTYLRTVMEGIRKISNIISINAIIEITTSVLSPGRNSSIALINIGSLDNSIPNIMINRVVIRKIFIMFSEMDL